MSFHQVDTSEQPAEQKAEPSQHLRSPLVSPPDHQPLRPSNILTSITKNGFCLFFEFCIHETSVNSSVPGWFCSISSIWDLSTMLCAATMGSFPSLNGILLCCCCLLGHVWLSCDPMDCSPPGSSVHGIIQASILEWVATSSSRGSSQPRDRTHLLHFLHWQADSWEAPHSYLGL